MQLLNFQPSPDDRLPPQNIAAEESILGGILLDPGAMDRVQSILLPEMFYLSAHQRIYQAAVTLHSTGCATDLVQVTSWLSDRGLLEGVGGQNRLADLVESCPSAVNIDQHAYLVVEKAARRLLIARGQQISQLGHGSGDLQTAIVQAQDWIFELATGNQKGSGPKPLHELINHEIQVIEGVAAGGVRTGLATGFYDLDALTGGYKPGDLVVIAGRPSMGKTAYAANQMRNAAALSKTPDNPGGSPMILFSMEMGGGAIARRLLAADAQISTRKMESANLSLKDWELMGAGAGRLSDLPIFVDDKCRVDVGYIRTHCLNIRAQYGNLGMVVVDYLHLMLDGQDDGSVREIGRVVNGCKQLARDLSVPIVLLSQLNRAVEGQSDKRPSMSNLRASGEIEQTADLIQLLYRDEYYNENSSDRGIAEINLVKHRNGPTGTIKLLFEPQYTLFRNLAPHPDA